MEKKEAMKILKEFRNKSALFSVRTALDTIIPELKESEDEKIRREIISIVKSYRESCITEGNHRFDDCLAWLEKQSEKKSTWSEEDEIGLDDALWAIEQARTIAKDETDMGNLWYAEHFLNSIKDRVQSQPKQVWSEDDKEQLDRAIYMMGQLGLTKSWDDVYNWLKSLKDRI